MSSSNLVRVAFIKETVYGETPGVGNFEQARFTSDSLSGSPETTESQQIRVDRYSSGQIVTGLTVAGDISFELAKEDAIDQFFESAMFNEFVAGTPVSVDLEVDITAETIERSSGDFNVDVVVGDIITLGGFADSLNNTQVIVTAINSATVITYIGDGTLVDEVGSGTDFVVADKLVIGTTKISFSIEKAFLDLTNKAIIYKGMIAGGFSITATYGEVINGSFSFSGNNYQPVSISGDFITDSRTINSAATSNSLNGSVDMPFLISSAVGTLDEAAFCIQSVEIALNNNLTAQTCIGEIAPVDYSPGTAQIEVNMSAYFSDDSYALLAKKLTQASFALGFMLKNLDGFYGFYMPAVQVSFDDPASAGINQDVILSMSGVAKVGSGGESPLTIYRS